MSNASLIHGEVEPNLWRLIKIYWSFSWRAIIMFAIAIKDMEKCALA